mmetsp:Transcript_130545/g.325695  ORF Transcript_130545/g.325695 Transcript_130545/m.325695 type:complete len:311 (-) Transcript_130545:379-1311(-)
MLSGSAVVTQLCVLAALARNVDTADPKMPPSNSSVPLLRKGAPGGISAANDSVPAAVYAHVNVSAFVWNIHWQCSVAAQGSSSSCKEKMGERLVELVNESDAEIVTVIELSNNMSDPVNLVALGLDGWTHVDGPCATEGRGDALALAFAPGWTVQKSGGGCLRHDCDTRAFAVARVTPPSPIQGCPSLCVVGLHAPHTEITAGKSIVSSICEDAVAACTIVMGDWNFPVEAVGPFWSQLVDGEAPTLATPNERTCCFPEEHHFGVFDHVVTNIANASEAGHQIYPYQLLEENPVQEHKPVWVSLALPKGD